MHLFLKRPGLIKCKKCGHFILPHIVCPDCGYYKNVEVIDVLKKLGKKEQKQRKKEMAQKEAEEKGGKEKSLTWEELSKK